MYQSPAALRIHTNHRSDFDSYFPLEDSTATDFDTDLKSLPFPAPLHSLRVQFRDDAFECDTFLLENQRHGQLDDLLSELRTLSQTLDAELTKGVEHDYEDFIALGKIDSKRIEELEKGVLMVQTNLTDLENVIQEDLKQVETVLAERRDLRARKQAARNVLRLVRAVDELAYMLDDDLESAVETDEYLRYLMTTTHLPESEQGRYESLRDELKERITRLQDVDVFSSVALSARLT